MVQSLIFRETTPYFPRSVWIWSHLHAGWGQIFQYSLDILTFGDVVMWVLLEYHTHFIMLKGIFVWCYPHLTVQWAICLNHDCPTQNHRCIFLCDISWHNSNDFLWYFNRLVFPLVENLIKVPQRIPTQRTLRKVSLMTWMLVKVVAVHKVLTPNPSRLVSIPIPSVSDVSIMVVRPNFAIPSQYE